MEPEKWTAAVCTYMCDEPIHFSTPPIYLILSQTLM